MERIKVNLVQDQISVENTDNKLFRGNRHGKKTSYSKRRF